MSERWVPSGVYSIPTKCQENSLPSWSTQISRWKGTEKFCKCYDDNTEKEYKLFAKGLEGWFTEPVLSMGYLCQELKNKVTMLKLGEVWRIVGKVWRIVGDDRERTAIGAWMLSDCIPGKVPREEGVGLLIAKNWEASFWNGKSEGQNDMRGIQLGGRKITHSLVGLKDWSLYPKANGKSL